MLEQIVLLGNVWSIDDRLDLSCEDCNSDGDSLSEEAVQKQQGHLEAKMLWLWIFCLCGAC